MESAVRSAVEAELSGRRALVVTSVKHADLLLEMIEKSSVAGASARVLADLYDEAKRVRAAFPSEPK